MSVRLRIDHGQDAGKIWRLAGPGVYLLGRDNQSSIRILDMKVSKGHCEIHVLNGNGGERVVLRDLKSTHGTLVNGQPVTAEIPLSPGDEIRIGLTILRLLSDGKADADAAPAASASAVGRTAAEMTMAPQDLAATVPEGAKIFPPDELVGTELGGYKVLRKIGQGGMGAVYIAEQVSLKREVALKVLSEKFVSDSAFVDQFVNEARAAGALNHQNVVQVYDVGNANGRYYFSMEFVAGGSIEDRVRKKSAPWPEALNWFLDAANALIFAQKRGILHRDVKPDNFMIGEDGSAKLCDLGLAKKSESADLLAQGIIGTPHFISPEAIRRRADLDARSDLYSLGCTFYRVLTGENPYPGKTVKDILLAHLNKPVPKVADRKPEVPKELADVVLRLMQKEPTERYQTADDLFQALDKIRLQHGLEAHGIRPGNRKALVIAAIVAVLALGAVAYLVLKPPPPHVENSAERLKREQDAIDKANADARANAAEFEGFLSRGREDFTQLRLAKEQENLAETWMEGKWAGVLGKFEELAKRLQDHETFGKTEQVTALAVTIRKEAKAIEESINGYREVKSDRTQKSEDAFGRFAAEAEKISSDANKALAEGRWIDALRISDPEVVTKALRTYQELVYAKLRDKPLLIPEGKFKEIIEKWVPPFLHEGKQDRWGGFLYDRAVKAEGDALEQVEIEARAKAGAIGTTVEAWDAAIDYVKDYLDTLPKVPDPPTDPDLAIERHRNDVEKILKEFRISKFKLQQTEIADGRYLYFQLIRTLWMPGRIHGLIWSFDLDAAKTAADTAKQAMRYPKYTALAEQEARDVAALRALFDDLRAAFLSANGWADGYIDKVKVKEVSEDGILCNEKEKRTWSDLGPEFLLDHVFFVKPDAPRFTFKGEDFRGLALLAEMAARKDQAQGRYMAYLATLDAADEATRAAILARMARLDVEMEALSKWLEAWKTAADVIEFMDRLDPGLHGNPELDPAARAKITIDYPELRKRLNDAQQVLRGDLDEEDRFASTRWGSVIRKIMHKKAAYTGEELPPGPPAPPAAPAVPAVPPAGPAAVPPGAPSRGRDQGK